MTIQSLVLLIGMACNLSGGGDVEEKTYCIEFYTNCMVRDAGEIDERNWNVCRKKYLKEVGDE